MLLSLDRSVCQGLSLNQLVEAGLFIYAMDPYVREFRVEGRLLQVRLAGTYPKERLANRENVFDPLIEACRKQNCAAAVIDSRELEVDLDTMELFRAGVDAAALNKLNLYVAFVVRDDMINPFFRDVMLNRGALACIFTDMESARAWINERVPDVN